MPPQPFIDVSTIDTTNVLVDREGIYEVLPHRYEFSQLDAIVVWDPRNELIVGYRDIRQDEFWVRGHIPGRPIFPGVLMIETAAQLVSYCAMRLQQREGFLGFGGVEDVKFRGSVVPGQRVIMVGKLIELRRRRCVGATQGFVDGRMVFQGVITGMWI
ncbi:MAG: beta-hydroxyacyl-ACP dehydratase [Planctomycetes bacterium]|nr:beta-hydroxyacyl-ACP dehydratase [Planctomycetota bacterium]